MNSLFLYLLELNMGLVIFFMFYQLIFERDKNFVTRRIYLMGSMLLTVIIPLVPGFREISPVQEPLLTIHLEGVTVVGSGSGAHASSSLTWSQWLGMLYASVVLVGLLRLVVQLISVISAVRQSEKRIINGIPILSNRRFHASSFFGYIFINRELTDENSFQHILDHERIHSHQWHSADRILVELFVMMNWFNPLAWMVRRAVIENLEFLADSTMLRRGTDPIKYQLSILNQYIGSASINNQFSSQIKNRINMLNKNYKLGSGWKLAILFPLIAIALIIASCADTEEAPDTALEEPELASEEISGMTPAAILADEPVFRVVEEMPTFQGGDPTVNFRKYIAQNIQYPSEAAENGVTGRIFIQFVVTKEGEVIVPDLETFAKIEGKSMDEVVVVTYRTMEKGEEVPEDKYIQMLKDEVIRVVSSSPGWEPGKQRGQAVNVAFTFPVNFSMQ